MDPYRPSGRSDPGALPKLLLSAVLVGLAVGLVAHGVGTFVRLLLLFAFLMALAVGVTLAVLVRRLRVRSPGLAAAAGVVGAACAFGADFAAGYVLARRELRQSAEQRRAALEKERGAPIDPAGVERAVDQELLLLGQGRDPDLSPDAALLGAPVPLADGTTVEPPPAATPHQLLAAYVALRPRERTTVQLGPTGAWVVFLGELVFMALVAAGAARNAASQPFSEEAGEWFDPTAELFPIAPVDRADDARTALEKGDGRKLARLLGAEPLEGRFVGLSVRRTGPSVPARGPVWAELLLADGKKSTPLLRGLLPGATFDAFRDEVKRIEEGRQADQAKKAEKKRGKVDELDPSDPPPGGRDDDSPG
jgi:hypothetical protein